MSRNAKIEAILEAQWNSIYSPERAAAQIELYRLIDELIVSQPTLSRDDVLDHLHGHFLEYRKERRKREQLIVPQSPKSK